MPREQPEKNDYFPRAGTILYRRARIALFRTFHSRQKPLRFRPTSRPHLPLARS